MVGAEVVLSRLDITWSMPLHTDAKGNYLQIGLEPRDFKITVSAPGLVTYQDQVKIPMTDQVIRNITLLTPQEARAEAPATVTAGPTVADAKAASGAAALIAGVESYNQQKFTEALPSLEKAVADLNESAATMPEGDSRKTLAAQIATAERIYGVVLVEVGKAEPVQPALVLKAEPYLATAYKNNPKDLRYVNGLIEVAKAKKDPEAVKKYQAEADAITGPRPELAFKEALVAWNASNVDQAMAGVQKTLAIDPKYPDSYYLLGLIELNKGDVKAAKAAWNKYLDLAPTGRMAAEIKGNLRDLQ